MAVEAESESIGMGSARSLLLTLFGEFVFPHNAPVWTTPLLDALAGLGIAEKAARQALSRAATARWIESEKDGRRTTWRLTPEGLQLITDGSSRVKTLRGDAAAWDGHWIVLHISLPEAHRSDRLRLYRALNWAGFGSPTPGIWICPHTSRAAEAERVIGRIGVAVNTLAFEARPLGFGVPSAEFIARAWDLERIAARYAALTAHFESMKPATSGDFLFSYIELVNTLQRLPSIDPGLPDALLPEQWPGSRHTASLMDLRASWRSRAHAQWKKLVADAGP